MFGAAMSHQDRGGEPAGDAGCGMGLGTAGVMLPWGIAG